jgi:hypothetical protein
MNKEKENSEFQEYFRGISKLSQWYKSGIQQEPARYLDENIITAARKSVSSQKFRNRYIPASIAAVMVIGVSLVFHIYHDEGHQAFSKKKSDVLIKNEIKQETNKENNQINPDSLPAEPADSIYPAVPVQDKAPVSQLRRQIIEPAPDSKQTIMKKQKLTGPEQSDKTIITVPVESKDQLEDGSFEQFELQGKSHVEETAAKEEAALKAIMSVEPGLSSSQEFELDKQDAHIQPDARKSEPSGIADTTVSAEQWLLTIKNLWIAGKKEEAIDSYKQFLKKYPEYPKEILIEQLPEDFPVQ